MSEPEVVAEQGKENCAVSKVSRAVDQISSLMAQLAIVEQVKCSACRFTEPSVQPFHWPRRTLLAEVSINTRFLWVNAHFH